MDLKIIHTEEGPALLLPNEEIFKKYSQWTLKENDDQEDSFILLPRVDNPYRHACDGEFYLGEAWDDYDHKEVD
ncbi:MULTISPECIES: hypothetical protein [Aerococcus]|uniref:hypothetical protein n=1 Tax=Aerococcus TaxID=1375 RepID=UPI000DCC8BD2|nr:hypothetical protein [Aerococcus urinae]MDK7302576.1 hypothetical protein [Aerococcus urinae]RAV70254.1 hypothetical protein DBT40_08115 [Aerococcus urinae]RAW04466.1 hypothetical protein DBT41_08225 [Aerococcus urinae]